MTDVSISWGCGPASSLLFPCQQDAREHKFTTKHGCQGNRDALQAMPQSKQEISFFEGIQRGSSEKGQRVVRIYATLNLRALRFNLPIYSDNLTEPIQLNFFQVENMVFSSMGHPKTGQVLALTYHWSELKQASHIGFSIHKMKIPISQDCYYRI